MERTEIQIPVFYKSYAVMYPKRNMHGCLGIKAYKGFGILEHTVLLMFQANSKKIEFDLDSAVRKPLETELCYDDFNRNEAEMFALTQVLNRFSEKWCMNGKEVPLCKKYTETAKVSARAATHPEMHGYFNKYTPVKINGSVKKVLNKKRVRRLKNGDRRYTLYFYPQELGICAPVRRNEREYGLRIIKYRKHSKTKSPLESAY